MLYDKEQVMQFLPHRDPFLFIDSVSAIRAANPDDEWTGEELSAAEKVRRLVGSEVLAHYYTRSDHPIFAGHFPGNPIMPGVVQVEMMAQAAGFVVHLLYQDITKLDLDVALLGVNSARFRRPVVPDMELTIKTKCLKSRGSIMTNECQLLQGDCVLSQAEIMASMKI